MKNAAGPLVIDASVAVKLFIPEELSDRAEKLFALLAAADPPTLFVPDLFFIECANVFRSRTKLRAMRPGQAIEALSVLLSLPFERLADNELAVSSLNLSLKYDLSVYDACYLSLATLIHAPLVTADKKLASKLSGTELPVRWLGEWRPE